MKRLREINIERNIRRRIGEIYREAGNMAKRREQKNSGKQEE